MSYLSNKIQVQCDDCESLFYIKLIEKPFPNKVIKTYFHCPDCKREYLVHYTDEWCRQEQKEIKHLNDERLRRRSRLLNRMDQLANEYEAST